MADMKKLESELRDTIEKEKDHLEEKYGEVLSLLDDEKNRLQKELRQEYRNARRYVRANPEMGVGAAFAGGVFVGIILTKLLSRK